MILDKARLIGAANNKLIAGPESVFMDINTSCNLNCSFCWIHPLQQKTPPAARNLPFKTIVQIMDAATRWQAKELVISGDGEPTLHPHFAEIINQARLRKLAIFLTTNATFNEPLLKVAARINHLYINLSAPDPALYGLVQSPRNPELFHTVIRNIRVLGQLAKKHGTPRIGLAFITNNKNFRSIPAMIKLAKELNIYHLTFRMMEPTILTKPLLLSTIEKQELLAITEPLLKTMSPFKTNLADICQELRGVNNSPYNIKRCFTGWYNIFIDFNLNVGLCCHNEKLVVGSLKKNTLEEIWASARAGRLRLKCKNDFNIHRAPFKGECEWCHWNIINKAIDHEVRTMACAAAHQRNNI